MIIYLDIEIIVMLLKSVKKEIIIFMRRKIKEMEEIHLQPYNWRIDKERYFALATMLF